MIKLQYCITHMDYTTSVRVRYYGCREEAIRMMDEVVLLCNGLMKRGYILDYRFEIVER